MLRQHTPLKCICSWVASNSAVKPFMSMSELMGYLFCYVAGKSKVKVGFEGDAQSL